MTVAIFGGSFDPPHIGHEQIVYKCLEVMDDVDQLIVVPTYLNPLKSTSKFEPQVRLELIHDIFDQIDRVQVCDYEVNQNRPVYSLETVQYIKQLYNAQKIYFIIGADNLTTLDKWKNIDKLQQLVEFIIITRELFEEKHHFKQIELDVPISSTQLKDELDITYIPKKIQNKVKKIWNKE